MPRKDKADDRAYERDWYRRNKNQHRITSITGKLRRFYGLSLVKYLSMYQQCGGRCEICRQPQSGGRLLCVDHDHETEAVRGLLCTTCNALAGAGAPDRLALIDKVRHYLRGLKPSNVVYPWKSP